MLVSSMGLLLSCSDERQLQSIKESLEVHIRLSSSQPVHLQLRNQAERVKEKQKYFLLKNTKIEQSISQGTNRVRLCFSVEIAFMNS